MCERSVIDSKGGEPTAVFRDLFDFVLYLLKTPRFFARDLFCVDQVKTFFEITGHRTLLTLITHKILEMNVRRLSPFLVWPDNPFSQLIRKNWKQIFSSKFFILFIYGIHFISHFDFVAYLCLESRL